MYNKIKNIEFSNPNHRIIIKKHVFKKFHKYMNKKTKNEAGGILLGNVYKDRCEIVKITKPNKYDSFGPNYFVRSKRGAQPQINRAWKKSNGTNIYLGEWHTHFANDPKPSLTDKNMIINSLNKTKMEINFLFLVIVGLNNTFWVGKQTREKLIELNKII